MEELHIQLDLQQLDGQLLFWHGVGHGMVLPGDDDEILAGDYQHGGEE